MKYIRYLCKGTAKGIWSLLWMVGRKKKTSKEPLVPLKQEGHYSLTKIHTNVPVHIAVQTVLVVEDAQEELLESFSNDYKNIRNRQRFILLRYCDR